MAALYSDSSRPLASRCAASHLQACAQKVKSLHMRANALSVVEDRLAPEGKSTGRSATPVLRMQT